MMSVIPFRRKTPSLVIGSEEQVEPGNISGNAKSKKRRERREILLNHNHNHNLYLPQKKNDQRSFWFCYYFLYSIAIHLGFFCPFPISTTPFSLTVSFRIGFDDQHAHIST